MTKEEFDLKVRQASVAIAGPVIQMWQIEHAARPDVFVGMFLSEILTQQIGLRIMVLEALEAVGFFEPPGSREPESGDSSESDGSPAPWDPPQIIN